MSLFQSIVAIHETLEAARQRINFVLVLESLGRARLQNSKNRRHSLHSGLISLIRTAARPSRAGDAVSRWTYFPSKLDRFLARQNKSPIQADRKYIQ